jgi:hypothetical protein
MSLIVVKSFIVEMVVIDALFVSEGCVEVVHAISSCVLELCVKLVCN